MTATTTTKPGLLKQVGFTLIELSIVLVIIGLIVGGVLVGQDLIKSAEVRSTIGQYEKYNSAVNTFRTKYNGMPGDLRVAEVASFSLPCSTMAGTAGLGDGNGILEAGAASTISKALGETACFWAQLSSANLVDGSYGATLTTAGAPATPFTAPSYLPSAKVGRGNLFAVYGLAGLNYYQIGPFATVTDAGGVYTFGTTGMTPVEAYNIDNKLDDGAPNTGIIAAKALGTAANTDPTFNAAATANTCTLGATATSTSSTYQRDSVTGGNDPSCAVRMRFN